MFLIYGQSLRGRIDQVPGRYYIATRFFHMFGIPLFPDRSYFVIEGPEREGEWEVDPLTVGAWQLRAGSHEKRYGFTGVRIAFSWKSAFFGWARGLLFVIGLVMTLLFVRTSSTLGYQLDMGTVTRLEIWISAGIPGCCWFLFLVSFWISKASPVRARQLQEFAARKGLDVGPRYRDD